jgi:hypothetical protein
MNAVQPSKTTNQPSEKKISIKPTTKKSISITPTKYIAFIPTATPTVHSSDQYSSTNKYTWTNRNPTPTPLPQDTEAPRTNIYYPQNGGELTWKMEGKICAVLNPPSDNQSHLMTSEFLINLTVILGQILKHPLHIYVPIRTKVHTHYQ